MKHLFFKKRLLKCGVFIIFCITAFMGTAKAGLDYYELYIGKKLILKRAVNQPLNLESLPITQANSNEQLIINYYQCNAPGKLASNRIITLKDADGNKVKEWKFADAKGSNAGMAISIKELLQLQKANKNSLTLFYFAEGKGKEEKLVSVATANKTVGLFKMKIKDNKQNELAAVLFYMKRYCFAI